MSFLNVAVMLNAVMLNVVVLRSIAAAIALHSSRMELLGIQATLGPPELLFILVLVLLVFGGAQLPKLARSLGRAQREFRTGLG